MTSLLIFRRTFLRETSDKYRHSTIIIFKSRLFSSSFFFQLLISYFRRKNRAARKRRILSRRDKNLFKLRAKYFGICLSKTVSNFVYRDKVGNTFLVKIIISSAIYALWSRERCEKDVSYQTLLLYTRVGTHVWLRIKRVILQIGYFYTHTRVTNYTNVLRIRYYTVLCTHNNNYDPKPCVKKKDNSLQYVSLHGKILVAS